MKTSSLRRAVASMLPRSCKRTIKKCAHAMFPNLSVPRRRANPDAQDLDLYWDAEFAEVLDTWGIGNTWHEIPFLAASWHGRVLDIACGTGITMEILQRFPFLEIHGCDISDFLIKKAVARGLQQDRLLVCDATQTPYEDNSFNFAYSIGSLEHFTEDGIDRFVQECHRITRYTSCHMMPVSRSGQNEGWMKTQQSFFNNSPAWWIERFKQAYSTVYTLDSSWNDEISVGKWFVCVKEERAHV